MKQLWKVLLPLRGIAIVLVILAHATIVPLIGQGTSAGAAASHWAPTENWGLFCPLWAITLELCRVAVPLFLFLSGHFLSHAKLTPTAIWTSIRRFLYPMLFWSLLAWGFTWRKGAGGWEPSEFLLRFATGTTFNGYFFLLLIIQTYLVARWIVPVVKARPTASLVTAAALQTLVIAYKYWHHWGELAPWPTFAEWLLPRFGFYVVLGIWTGLYPERLKSLLARRLPALAALGVLAAALLVLESGWTFQHLRNVDALPYTQALMQSVSDWKISTMLWSVVGIPLLLAIALRWLPIEKRFKELGKDAYPIFLIHGMVFTLAKMLLWKADLQARLPVIGVIAIFVALGLGVPMLLARFVRKRVKRPLLRTVVIGE